MRIKKIFIILNNYMDILIIYHGGSCKDAFISGLTIKYFHNKDKCVLMQNNNYKIDVKYDSIYIVDCCLSNEELETLYSKCSNITIIDHHKTNKEIIDKWRDRINTSFDVSVCASILVWKYFTNAKIPTLHKIIDDEDRWQWEIPKSKEISRGLRALNFFVDDNNNDWRFRLFQLSYQELIKLFYKRGLEVVSQENEILYELEKKSKNLVFRGLNVLGVEADLSPELRSELGSRLAYKSEGKIGAVYRRKPYSENILVSLRAKAPVDLTELGAKGHPLSAGLYFENIDEFNSEFKNL